MEGGWTKSTAGETISRLRIENGRRGRGETVACGYARDAREV